MWILQINIVCLFTNMCNYTIFVVTDLTILVYNTSEKSARTSTRVVSVK